MLLCSLTHRTLGSDEHGKAERRQLAIMQLKDVITKNPKTVNAHDSIRMASRIMRDDQIGFLPVTIDGNVLGVLTDRDIAIRAIAGGFDPETTKVGDIMTMNPIQLSMTDTLETACETMAQLTVARLIVTDHSGMMVGVVSCGDLAMACKGDERAGRLTAAIHRRAKKVEELQVPLDAQFVSE